MNTKITIYDIAKELDISTSTVSRALKGNEVISAKMRDRVMRKAVEMGYITSSSMKPKKNTIIFVVPEINNDFYGNILATIQDRLSDTYLFLISCSFNSMEKEKKIVSMIDASSTCCLIISQSMDAQSTSHLTELEEKGVPIVMFNRVDYDYNCPKFLIDNYADAYNLTTHLINTGYRKIAMAAKHYNCSIYKDRIRGYEYALKKNNLEFNKDYIIYSELTNEDTYDVVRHFINLETTIRPDALILPDSLAALQAISLAKLKDLKIPEVLGIVSFDEDPECIYSSPSITAIERPLTDIGYEIADQIIAICEEEKYETNLIRIFKSQLLIRGSSLRKI